MEWTPPRGQAGLITAQFDRLFHEITSKQSTQSVFQKGVQLTCTAIDNAACSLPRLQVSDDGLPVRKSLSTEVNMFAGELVDTVFGPIID